MTGSWVFLVVAVIMLVYVAPSIVAAIRNVRFGRVLAVNLLLGWTVVGWIAAWLLVLWPRRKPEYVPMFWDGTVYTKGRISIPGGKVSEEPGSVQEKSA